MATTHWRTGHSVEDLFSQNDVNWSFYQLLRILMPMGLSEDELLANLHQSIRFRACQKTDFPPAEIRQLKPLKNINQKGIGSNKSWEISCVINNISGLGGPIAEPFNEMLRQNSRDGEGEMSDFFDIFNQRIQILRYLSRVTTDSSLSNSNAQSSRQGKFMLALSGNYYQQHRKIYNQSESTLLGLAGGLANRRLGLPVVSKLLKKVMNLELIKMNSLQGKWLDIDKSDHIKLGQSNHRLSQQATLGTKVWDQHAVVELVIGGFDHVRAQKLIPDGKEHQQLKQLLDWITDCRCDCRVTLVFAQQQNYQLELSKSSSAKVRLGYTSWLPEKRKTKRKISFMVNTVNADVFH